MKNIAVTALLILAACTGQPIENGPNRTVTNETTGPMGILEGTITVAPLCPVERQPPRDKCQPDQETYENWPVAVHDPQDRRVTLIQPNASGHYTEKLPTGTYTMKLDKELTGPENSNLPENFTIIPGETTRVAIDIDTGIQ